MNAISPADARRAARNIGALVAASILSKGILFGWQIILGRMLGPFDYGIYNTVFPLLALGAPLASLSMGLIAIREIARAPQKIGQYAASMLFTQSVLSIIAYIVIVLAGSLAGYSPAIVALTAIAGISLIVDMFGNIANDLLIAQERMVITSAIDIGQILVRVGLAALALWSGWGLLGIYLVTIAIGVLRSVLLWGIHSASGLRLQWPLDWPVITWPLLLNAAPLALAALLSLGYDHADKLMMTRFLGETNTGYLGPAYVIHFGIVELLSTTLLVAMYPLLSRLAGSRGETFGFVVEKLARFMLIAALPVVLALAVFTDDLIRLVYSDAYAPTVGILRIYVWYTLLTMVGNVFSKALLVQNRQRFMLWVRGASLALNIGLNAYLLSRTRDPRAAAVAAVTAEILALSLMAGTFRAVGFDWVRIVPGVLRVLMIGAGMAAAMLFFGQMNVMVGITVGALVYAAGIVYGGVLHDSDWDLLYRLAAAMPGGTLIRRYWKRETVVNW